MKGMMLFLMLVVCMTASALAETTVTLTFAGDVTLGSEERLWTEESSLGALSGAGGGRILLRKGAASV